MPTSRSCPVVLIAASAGGFRAVSTVVRALPARFPAAIVLFQHRSPSRTSLLTQLLARQTALPVVEARSGQVI